MKKLFTCLYSIENWKTIEKHGGQVIHAGCLYIDYWAETAVPGFSSWTQEDRDAVKNM